MANGVMNIALGRFIEKFADANGNGGLLLLKQSEAEDDLLDHTNLASLLAASGNVEADFTNYARKVGITGTITVDNVNNRTDFDIADQTWPSAGGASNNDLVKAVPFYEESAAESGRVPLAHFDFIASTDGNALNLLVNASGLLRAGR